MSQPDWTKTNIELDVLVVFSITDFIVGDVLVGDLPYKFSLDRGVDQPASATWKHTDDLQGRYRGLVKSVSRLPKGIGLEIKPKTQYPSTRVTIIDDNSDFIQAFKTKIQSQDFGSGGTIPVGIFVLEKGSTPDPATDLYYVGLLDARAVKYFPRESIEIELFDRMKFFDVDMPPEVFENEDEIDPNWAGKQTPVLFGDWSDPASYYQIEAACIDTRAVTDLKFQLSSVPSSDLVIGDFGDQVMRVRSGEDDAFFDVTGGDVNFGTFFADDTNLIAYVGPGDPWEEGDEWYLKNPVGLAQAFNNATVDNPADIWKWFIISFAPGDTGDIDNTSQIAAKAHYDQYSIKARRWIRDVKKLTQYMDELAYEFSFFSYVDNDQFYINQQSFQTALQATEIYYSNNIMKDPRLFIQFDPKSWVASGVKMRYGYDPRRERHTTYILGGSTPFDDRETFWIYDEDTASNQNGFWNLASTRPPKYIKLTVSKQAMNKNPSDKFGIEYRDETGDEYQIFNIATTFGQGKSEIEGLSLSFAYVRGAWTEDAAPTWTLADSRERNQQGFWSADSGDCDPSVGDQEAYDSNWTEG